MRRVVTVARSGLVAFVLTIKAIFQRDKKLLSNLSFFWAIVLLFPFVAPMPWFGNLVARVLAYPLLWVSGTGRQIHRNLDILLGPDNGVRPYTVSLHLANEYVHLVQNKVKGDWGIRSQYILSKSAMQLVERWDRGETFIVVGGHFGYPQASVSGMAACGIRFFVPVEMLEPAVYSEFINWLRMPKGCIFESVGGKTTLRRAMRRMKNDKDRAMPAILFDRVVPGEGKVYPFCNGFNEFGTGPAILSRLTGANLYFGAAVDEGIGKPTIYIEGPVIPKKSNDAEDDIDAVMGELIAIYERWVRLYPEQLTGAARMNIMSFEEMESTLL